MSDIVTAIGTEDSTEEKVGRTGKTEETRMEEKKVRRREWLEREEIARRHV
jgi:hypothetical protein